MVQAILLPISLVKEAGYYDKVQQRIAPCKASKLAVFVWSCYCRKIIL